VVIRVFPSSNGPGIYPRPSGVSHPFLISTFQGLQNLLDRIERMRALGPEFVDITWCALPLSCSYQKL
jgi:5,10-methylenetetrahydrofolate reductase